MKVNSLPKTPIVSKRESITVSHLILLILNKQNDEAIDLINRTPTYILNIHDEEHKMNPLQLAITVENIEVVNSLLSAGANPYEKCRNGNDAFYYAVRSNNPKILGEMYKYQKIEWFCCYA